MSMEWKWGRQRLKCQGLLARTSSRGDSGQRFVIWLPEIKGEYGKDRPLSSAPGVSALTCQAACAKGVCSFIFLNTRGLHFKIWKMVAIDNRQESSFPEEQLQSISLQFPAWFRQRAIGLQFSLAKTVLACGTKPKLKTCFVIYFYFHLLGLPPSPLLFQPYLTFVFLTCILSQIIFTSQFSSWKCLVPLQQNPEDNLYLFIVLELYQIICERGGKLGRTKKSYSVKFKFGGWLV